MKLKTDLERAEFIMRLPFIRDFEIKNKSGIKCIEKAVKYREEGNKLFQSDQCTQAILFYNKSISYCPHPTYDQWQQGLEQEQEKVKEVQFADECKDPNKKVPSKYESLSLSYGNRQTCKRCLAMFDDGECNIFGDACLNNLFPPIFKDLHVSVLRTRVPFQMETTCLNAWLQTFEHLRSDYLQGVP